VKKEQLRADLPRPHSIYIQRVKLVNNVVNQNQVATRSKGGQTYLAGSRQSNHQNFNLRKEKTNILRKTATDLRKIIVLAWPGIAYYMLTQKGYVPNY